MWAVSGLASGIPGLCPPRPGGPLPAKTAQKVLVSLGGRA